MSAAGETGNLSAEPPTTAAGSAATSDEATKKFKEGTILEAIEDFDSSIPDAVVQHFLNGAGLQTTDQRITRLIAIAAQKFIHDIVTDSLQHCKLRGSQGKKTKDKKYVLAIEDLAAALTEYGIEVRRQHYFN